jgi:hypothetical protein
MNTQLAYEVATNTTDIGKILDMQIAETLERIYDVVGGLWDWLVKAWDLLPNVKKSDKIISMKEKRGMIETSRNKQNEIMEQMDELDKEIAEKNLKLSEESDVNKRKDLQDEIAILENKKSGMTADLESERRNEKKITIATTRGELEWERRRLGVQDRHQKLVDSGMETNEATETVDILRGILIGYSEKEGLNANAKEIDEATDKMVEYLLELQRTQGISTKDFLDPKNLANHLNSSGAVPGLITESLKREAGKWQGKQGGKKQSLLMSMATGFASKGFSGVIGNLVAIRSAAAAFSSMVDDPAYADEQQGGFPDYDLLAHGSNRKKAKIEKDMIKTSDAFDLQRNAVIAKSQESKDKLRYQYKGGLISKKDYDKGIEEETKNAEATIKGIDGMAEATKKGFEAQLNQLEANGSIYAKTEELLQEISDDLPSKTAKSLDDLMSKTMLINDLIASGKDPAEVEKLLSGPLSDEAKRIFGSEEQAYIEYRKGLEKKELLGTVDDAIITPGGIVKTDPNDWLIATKPGGPLWGGGAGGGNMNLTFNISGAKDPRQVADEVIKILKEYNKYV